MTTGTDDYAATKEYLDDIHVDRAVAVSPSDTNELAHYSRSIYVGGGAGGSTPGNLKVTMLGGDVVTLANVPLGTWLDIRVKLVWNTGTTATSIVAFW